MSKPFQFITASRLSSARACQRLQRIKYVLGYRPKASAHALRFGTFMHKGFEAWWLAPEGERLSAALAALASVTDMDPYDLARAQVLMTGYDLRWAPEMVHYEVLGVEKQFLTPLRNPLTGRTSRDFMLAGKLDVIVRDLRDALVRVVEHKTSSDDISHGSSYWKRLRMDGQISVYFEGGNSLGYEIAGVLYDVAKKPKLQVLEANSQRDARETPEAHAERVAKAIGKDVNAYFVRGEVVRLEADMEDAMVDVWQLAQQIREAERLGRAPRNPDACERWNRTCEFFEVCTRSASLDDPLLFEKVANIHPELEFPTAETPKEGATI